MIMNKIHFTPEIDTPKPSKKWIQTSNKERVSLINEIIKKNKYDAIKIYTTFDHGEVSLEIVKDLSLKDRGKYLLDFELILKKSIDEGIYIMVQPLSDKNSLRKLRGINITKGYED